MPAIHSGRARCGLKLDTDWLCPAAHPDIENNRALDPVDALVFTGTPKAIDVETASTDQVALPRCRVPVGEICQMPSSFGLAEETDRHQSAADLCLSVQHIQLLEIIRGRSARVAAQSVKEDLAKQRGLAEPICDEGLVLACGLVFLIVFSKSKHEPRPSLERALEKPEQVAKRDGDALFGSAQAPSSGQRPSQSTTD